MTNLAIKGHATRGKEVIEILEMLGGKNHHKYIADCESLYFYIDGDTKIIYFDWLNCLKNGDVYLLTLEEFLEKFPYKVGDKVRTSYKEVGKVSKAKWHETIDQIRYVVAFGNQHTGWFSPFELEPYKKQESMQETIKIDIPKGYEFAGVDDDKQQVVFAKIQSHYPKTYKECAKELGYNQVMPTDHILGYKGTLLSFFQQLLICRDAYWKIAGDWKPDFTAHGVKYCLYNEENIVVASETYYNNYILTFPTSEIRDNFYENFEKLIEECKELL